jgi:polyisoprenoid-binding protein YceI
MLWFIDLSHSSIEFSVKHMMLSTAKGRFTNFRGNIAIDEANLALSTVNLEIEADSIQTGDTGRDEHLRQSDFFDVVNYPTINFDSTQIIAQSEKTYQVIGNLTLHGVTRPVSLQVKLEGKIEDMYGRDTYVFNGAAMINRKDFGLTWHKVLETGGFVVGEQVNIYFNIEAQTPVPATQAVTV